MIESPSSQPAPAVMRENFRHLVYDIGWFGIGFPAVARFLSLYAIRLDASAALLGWLTALPAIVALVTSAGATWWRAKFTNTVQAQLVPGLFYRLVFLLPAFTPFFPADFQPYWLVLSASLPAIPQGIASVIFLVTLREAVSGTDLTALMSRRSLVFNIIVAISTLVFGFWLEWIPFPANYQVMYGAAFLCTLMSSYHISRVKTVTVESVVPSGKPGVRVWRTPAFQGVVVITVLLHVAFYSILPIIPLWLVEKFDADEAFMSIFALAELAAAAATAALTNRIVRRTGSRRAIAIGLIGTALAAFLLAVAPGLWFTVIPGAISGGMWTLAAISLFNYFSENTPPEQVTRYSTAYNQVVMLSVFIGPMLGSQLASTSISLMAVMLLGAGLRLVAGALIPFDIVGKQATAAPIVQESHPERAGIEK